MAVTSPHNMRMKSVCIDPWPRTTAQHSEWAGQPARLASAVSAAALNITFALVPLRHPAQTSPRQAFPCTPKPTSFSGDSIPFEAQLLALYLGQIFAIEQLSADLEICVDLHDEHFAEMAF